MAQAVPAVARAPAVGQLVAQVDRQAEVLEVRDPVAAVAAVAAVATQILVVTPMAQTQWHRCKLSMLSMKYSKTSR